MGLGRLRGSLCLQLPVCPHLLLRHLLLAAGLLKGCVVCVGEVKCGVVCCLDLRLTWFKVWKSCAVSSTTLSRPSPSGSGGRTESRRPGKGLGAVNGQQLLRCPAVPF